MKPALRLVSFTLAAAAALANPALRAQPAPAALPAGITQVTSVEGITEYRLANGLQVLLVPDASKPTTTVNVTYRVGSRHENYGETGMAHLLEHLLFKGTPTNKNVWADFSKRGLRANGSTWVDRTNYFASFAANDDNLRWYLSWQADAMVNSFIAKADLDTEMTVVRNEFEAGENNPGRVLFEKLLAGMYDWHNYGKSTIGARTDIENVDIPRLQAFYKKHYQPDNATLVVSGQFDAAKVMGWIAQYFGPLPKPTRAIERTYTLDPAQDGERIVNVRRVGGAPLIYVGYHVPPGSHPDFAAVALLSRVLGDTPGGRLHKRVVERQRLASQAFGEALSLAEPSPLIFGVALAPTQSLTKARTALATVLDGVATEPVTSEELERARIGWLNVWDLGFTDPEQVGVAMSEAIAQGDWRLYFLQRDRVRAVTLTDINRVAKTWLKPDNRTVALYEPVAKPDRAPTQALVDVAAQVQGYKGDATAAVAEAFDPTPANLERRSESTTVGGIKATLLPKGTRGRVVRARLALHQGTDKTLFGQESVARLMGSLFDKGGGGLTRQQIADRFDQLQAQVGFSATPETVFVDITTKRERLPEVIDLVGRLLRQPAFDAGALEETRQQTLTELAQQRKEPDALISRRLARHGNPWPKGDPRHVRSFDEIEADAKAVKLEQVKAFHRRFVSAQKGEFAAVGDMDAAAVKLSLDKALGTWRQPAAGPQQHARVTRPLYAGAPQRFVEITPDKANANFEARLMLPINDSHADHAALELANTIFGRSDSSRLWVRIRETEGLSYDVRSYFVWGALDAATRWEATAIFAPQNQAKVEAAFKQELERSLKDGFTQAELDQERTGLLNRRRLARAQDGIVTEQISGHLYVGRGFAFAQAVDEALARATLEQVNAAWRRHIDPARVVTAWGGDFKQP
jgi:zinc protease